MFQNKPVGQRCVWKEKSNKIGHELMGLKLMDVLFCLLWYMLVIWHNKFSKTKSLLWTPDSLCSNTMPVLAC